MVYTTIYSLLGVTWGKWCPFLLLSWYITKNILFFTQVWRVKYTLAKIRKAARELLTLDEKDTKRLFEGIYIYLLCSYIIITL